MIYRFQVISDKSHTFHKTVDDAFDSAFDQLKRNPDMVFAVQAYANGEWIDCGIVSKKMIHKF